MEPHYLSDHTSEVIDLAVSFAKTFDHYSISEISALLHDQGKKSDAFQEYINSEKKIRGSVRHAMGGALALKDLNSHIIVHIIQLIVLGHHTQLKDYNKLSDSLQNVPPELIGIEERMVEETEQATTTIEHVLKNVTMNVPIDDQFWYFSTLTRFCFSALIDADWLSAEKYFNPEKAKKRIYEVPSASSFIEKLDQHMDEKKLSSPSSKLNTIRTSVYEAAKQAARRDDTFYVLNSPTGSGKTLASLAFALHHAGENECAYSEGNPNKVANQRIIFALPLTNVTEQTSEIYRMILGEEHVIEHHSQFDLGSRTEETDKLALATENWDRKFIVTTTYQLFQSLFSHRTNPTRKLHRIANSIIIIDEYQKLPLHVLKPILRQLKTLREHFGVTVLFMSATPLALEQSVQLKGVGIPQPITDQSNELFKQMKRVHYQEIHKPLEVDELVTKMEEHDSVLCIVNTRNQAQRIFTELQRGTRNWNHIYHLSTTMCGHHRLDVINKIKGVRKGETIAVVSNQVLEAGVDVSFNYLFRMYAPLDSIIQSAGRCNREDGSEKGLVYLFDLIEQTYPDEDYRQKTEKTRQLIEQEGVSVLDDPEQCISYFNQVYSILGDNTLDKYGLSGNSLLQFREVSNQFKMIEDDNRESVICMDYPAFPHEIYQQSDVSRQWYRAMQPYMIQLNKQTIEQLQLKTTHKLYVWEGPYDPFIGYALGPEGRRACETITSKSIGRFCTFYSPRRKS